MEAFFNLLWVAISLLMVGFWLARTARGDDDPVRHSIGVQLIALALLIVILLPVVSLTDDLHASAMLAEADHMWRRCDFQAIGDLALHAVAVAITGLALLQIASQSRTVAWLSMPPRKANPCSGYQCVLATRPPPTV